MEFREFTLQNTNGVVVQGANVYVYEPNTTTQASIFDENGSALTQPLISDSSGNVAFSAPNGSYDVVATQNTFSQTIENARFFDPDELTSPTRAEFVAANTAGAFAALTDGDIKTVEGLDYIREAASTDISGLSGWKPAPPLASPGHFGGVSDGSTDATAAVQAALDFAKATYNTSTGDFDYRVDLGGKFWMGTNVNVISLAQPRFTIQNGGLYFTSTAKFGLELFGSNSVILENLRLECAESGATVPGVILGFGRTGPGLGIAPSLKGNVIVQGSPTKASVLNIGSEVSDLDLIVINNSTTATSVGVANIGNMAEAADFWGADFTSDNATLPATADGSFSNILHDYGSIEIKRAAQYNVTITAITQANPAVVSFDAANTTITSAMANGDTVFLKAVGGMVEVNGNTYTIANLSIDGDGLGGTFELSGTDSSAFTAYTGGGNAWRTTGHCLFIGAGASISVGPAAYLLSYGYPPIYVSMTDSETTVSDLTWHGQTEAQAPYLVQVNVGAQNKVIQRMVLRDLSSSQEHSGIFKLDYTASGSLRIDALDLHLMQQGETMADGICNNQAQLTLRNAFLRTPIAMDISSLAGFSGVQQVMNPDTMDVVGDQFTLTEILMSTGAALSQAGIRWSGDSYYGYREDVPAERRFQVQDTATTTQIEDVAHRVNTKDKYAGKMVWNASTGRPVWAAGGTAGALWVDHAGTTVHTPT